MVSDLSVTVVIPTHARPDLLKRAISSVLNQTILPHEILVVDDFGCNSTQEVIASFESSLLKYILNKNGHGASSSRNLGVNYAFGNYVAFLDDDDEWLPQKLEFQIDKIKENTLDACFSQVLIKYENTDISYSTRAQLPEHPEIDILLENFVGGTISAIVRKNVYVGIGGFDEDFPAREEYDLWIRLITEGYSVDFVEVPLAIAYRSLENRGRISSNISSYVYAVELLNLKHSALVEGKLTPSQIRLRSKLQNDFLAAQAVSIGLRSVSIKYYSRSWLYFPSLKSFLCLLVVFVSPRLLIRLRAKVHS